MWATSEGGVMGMDRARRMTPPGFAKRVVSVRVELMQVCGQVKPLFAAHVILACKHDDMAIGTAQCLFVNCCCGDGVSLRLHWDKIACVSMMHRHNHKHKYAVLSTRSVVAASVVSCNTRTRSVLLSLLCAATGDDLADRVPAPVVLFYDGMEILRSYGAVCGIFVRTLMLITVG